MHIIIYVCVIIPSNLVVKNTKEKYLMKGLNALFLVRGSESTEHFVLFTRDLPIKKAGFCT